MTMPVLDVSSCKVPMGNAGRFPGGLWVLMLALIFIDGVDQILC